MSKRTLRIGTRGSELALWQSRHVSGKIRDAFGIECDLVVIKTSGDIILDRALSEVGGKGLFVKEIEEALLRRDIDLAVHSMKDVPAFLPEGLEIGAILEREDPRDAFVSNTIETLAALPDGARIGTSSLRRLSQLRRVRPDLAFLPLRGNVGTRLRKMDDGQVDALILAGAGLKRLGFESRIREWISADILLPAIGQGALGIEIRSGDQEISGIVESLSHTPTRIAVSAERGVLKSLNGGCQVPIAAFAVPLPGGRLRLEGRVLTVQGTKEVRISDTSEAPTTDAAERLGWQLGNLLLENGGREILSDILPPGGTQPPSSSRA
jgi:hydroxymethylbilane synthase